jgi:CHAT domain-containing protein/tetratricopeptide (TPR) repeat protein
MSKWTIFPTTTADTRADLGPAQQIARLVLLALILPALIFAATLTTAAGAESRAEWHALNARVVQAVQNGNGDAAVTLAKRALSLARSKFGPRDADALTSLHTLALVLQVQGQYTEAEKLHREALKLRRQVLGPNHPETLASMNDLADLLNKRGQYSEAEKLYQETLDGRRQVLGPKHPATATSMDNLAVVLGHEGRFGEAESLHREALDAYREVLGAKHPDTLTAMHNLGGTLTSQGRYGEAESQLRKTVELRREVQGPKDPDTLSSMNSLSVVLQSQGRYAEAESLHRETLDLRRRVLGPKHPDTLTSMDNLASVLGSEGRYGEAESLHREALDLYRQTLGPKHPDTVTCLNNLALVLQREGRYSEAEPLFREVLALDREMRGPENPGTLNAMNNLAVVLKRQGKYSEAEQLYRTALDLSRQVLGAQHPNTLLTQLNLTSDLAAHGNVAAAIALHRKMEPLVLDRLGAELYTIESASVRRQMVASQSTYQNYALTLAQLPGAGPEGPEMAASALLRFKGLAMEEDAYLGRLARRGEDEHIRAVVNELQGLHAQMARVFQDGASAHDVADLTARTDAKQLELGRLSRNYADSLQVRKTSVQDLRGLLAKTEQSALLEFRLYQRVDFKTSTFGPERVAGVLVTAAGDIVVRDLGASDDIEADVSVLLSGSSDAATSALYQQVIAPFAADLSRLKHLYVAPDGVLNLVPFGLLRDADGQRVLDRLDLRTVLTGRDLLRPVVDKPAKGLVAIGGIDFDFSLPTAKAMALPPSQADAIADRAKITRGDTLDSLRFGALAYSREEVEVIADLYRRNRQDEKVAVAEGARPTKEWLLGLPPARVLHLATHGFYRARNEPSDQPMLLAGIAMAGANRGASGILYALEAQDLNLEGTELVVLSACETAQGQYDYGDGVAGLVRALRVAGAHNVLVTLRPVNDRSARQFMESFYRHWLGDPAGDAAAALQRTQKDYLAAAASPSPTPTNAPTAGEVSANSSLGSGARGAVPLWPSTQNADPTWASFILVGK